MQFNADTRARNLRFRLKMVNLVGEQNFIKKLSSYVLSKLRGRADSLKPQLSASVLPRTA